MNDMVPTDRRDLLPDVCRGGSQELAEAVQRVLNPHPDLALNALVVDDATRQEAEARLRLLNAAMKPASAQHWMAFLKPLVPSVGNPPTRDAFTAFVSSVAFGLNYIPAAVLTEERSREAVCRFKFWPSGEELSKWLSPFVFALRDEQRALDRLRRCVAPKATRANAAQRTDAERAHVTAAARAFAADMAALNKPRGTSPARPGHVGDDELLIAYERLAAEPGKHADAARTRVAALRRKLGRDAA